jgi:hypothetical protein
MPDLVATVLFCMLLVVVIGSIIAACLVPHSNANTSLKHKEKRQ